MLFAQRGCSSLTELAIYALDGSVFCTPVGQVSLWGRLQRVSSKNLKNLVVDTCITTDEDFSNLFEHLSGHRFLNSVSISNCKMGMKTLSALADMTGLSTLRLTNIGGL